MFCDQGSETKLELEPLPNGHPVTSFAAINANVSAESTPVRHLTERGEKRSSGDAQIQ